MPIDQIIHCKLYNVSNCKPFFQRKKTILCCVETTKREKKWNIVGLLQTNQVLFTALCLELPGNVTPSYGTYFKNYCYSDIGTYNLYRGYSAHELILEIFPKWRTHSVFVWFAQWLEYLPPKTICSGSFLKYNSTFWLKSKHFGVYF